MRILFSVILLQLAHLFSINAVAQQSPEIEIFGGMSNYQGDLRPVTFTLQDAKAAFGFNAYLPVVSHVYLRAGYSDGRVTASDADNNPNLRPRNLSFYSNIREFHLGIEGRLFNPDRFKLTPYGFVGLGLYHFNPYAFHPNYNGRVYLQPLGTEGQGLPGYEDRQPYKLWQMSVPYAFGIRWQATCNFHLALEFKQSKLFTDYLDDVSTTYPAFADLVAGRSMQTVDMSWRRIEYDGRPFPTTNVEVRGNPNLKDGFYFVVLKAGVRLFDCDNNEIFYRRWFGGGGNNVKGYKMKGKRRSSTACPVF